MGCSKMRRMLITHSVLDIETGEETPKWAEWVTQKCNAPMFDHAELERGVCRSCFNGWTHPLNFPVDEEYTKD
jgi:hypothetical protein